MNQNNTEDWNSDKGHGLFFLWDFIQTVFRSPEDKIGGPGLSVGMSTYADTVEPWHKDHLWAAAEVAFIFYGKVDFSLVTKLRLQSKSLGQSRSPFGKELKLGINIGP